MTVVIKTRYIHDEVADTDGNARTTVKVQQVGLCSIMLLAWHYDLDGESSISLKEAYDDISDNADDIHLSTSHLFLKGKCRKENWTPIQLMLVPTFKKN